MLERVIGALNKASSILILFHESPDGDAVASSLALGMALEQKKKKVDYICRDPIPKVFSFLPGIEKIRKDCLLGDYDIVCTVDCGDVRRTGFAERVKEYSKHRTLINIDHHLKNDLHKIATINFTNDKVAASAELVFEIIKALNAKMNRDMATLVLTGLYTDTGGFQHSNTCPRVYALASRLMSYGARLNKISQNIALNKRLSCLKLWGLALSRIKKNSYGIVTSYVTSADFEKFGANLDDLAGVVNIINSTPNAKATILFAEQGDGTIKASIRTESNVIDICKIARLFGGGGHKKAAGFTLKGRIIDGKKSGWSIDLTS
ncbi:MAG TPA: bifunctional oligoribonuclease/PAP phosphatase NrnA [bacterium]|jgi:phosphoesterase RecJ-like protein|nr:bifunctional oligoribonuclease/PAP phosphatase NrnA [bacterium]